MRITFTIGEPAIIFRYNLLEVCIKFAAVFGEIMESVPEIGGGDRVRVYAVHNDSSHFCFKDFCFPLRLSCRIDGLEAIIPRVYANLYFNKETNEVLVWVNNISRKEFCGDIDTVVKELSTAILKQLQNPLGPF